MSSSPLCESLDPFDLLFLLWESKEDNPEKEEEDDHLCLLLFFVLCFVLGWSLLLRLDRDGCLSADCQMLLGGPIMTLWSDIWLSQDLEVIKLSLKL